MTLRLTLLCIASLLIASLPGVEASAKNLKVAVVQTLVEPRLEGNLAKVLGFIDRAKEERCRLLVLSEHVLLPFEAPEKPTKAQLDEAFGEIQRRAKSGRLCVVFSDGYRRTEGGAYETHGIVYTGDGAQAVLYRKNLDVPRPFVVDGVACNLSVCSDRGYLEHSDLPCLALGSQIIIDSSVGSRSSVKPLSSEVREIKIAAAQMACSRDMNENVRRIRHEIVRAAEQKADVVVFPELAVTGSRAEDIRAATQSALDDAPDDIRAEAKLHAIYVIVGMPAAVGDRRYNCAIVIGDDGAVKTRCAQLAATRADLFRAGQSAKCLWFSLKGVPSIVTVGEDGLP